MAVSNQLTRVIRVSFGIVLTVALFSLLSAIFLSSRSEDILAADDDLGRADRSAPGASGISLPVREAMAAAGSRFVKSWCVRRTARQEEVEQVIQNMETQERSRVFEKIFREDYWGGGESRSGPGSRKDYTANVRKLLALAIKTYGVKELLDSPCGDVNWQTLTEGFNATTYTGFDIVPDMIRKNEATFQGWPNMKFARVDFTNTPIDETVRPDLIICRDAIQHNALKDGLRGLANLESTGAKYILTNWHSPPRPNKDIKFGDFYLIDVFTRPFNFSKPEMFISEGVNGHNSEGKFAGLWKLPALLKGDGRPFRIPESLVLKARQHVVTSAELEAELIRLQRPGGLQA
ncbi:hypothetical protein MPTK1_1g23220 [Marchantia polymorpha subsp. ruderalis]|uniref:Methyltransferase domain-containing protein n=2 Tax=Marchantia polymorpha TaxID=3197 RepID=A0A176WPJ0_MARPO|nr:hypothetical protein AXG93_1864s1470 [Marchantia polymorpha subsp. ruderalis]PTQ36246.1 hypothetical protein MARPO_0065s0056 [Marchantia polymorpha]BBM99710.1 hypothetical protein Mp_1g23220 [Marchantia polymorpha subsp. ruderalis]|eukprot:PTQ36246.1 hypothetical protein MARPO_0065s0056 [Marchantia polymorpha]